MGEIARYTYRHGSRPEGVAVYDDGTKIQSWHDSDPAHGQQNVFDLVRLHQYGYLDSPEDLERPVTERPSFRCMADLIAEDPVVQAAAAAAEFTDLGPADSTPALEASPKAVREPLARRLDDVIATPTQTRWLLRDELEHGVIALMAGPRGSYKSFKALHWAMRVAVEGHAVYVVSAEGGDFGRRAEAWARHHGYEGQSLPVYVAERRLDLNSKDGIEAIRQDCLLFDIRPKLFVLDTFSKLSGGLDENDNSEVKLFLGRLDNGLKRPITGFDATVLLIAHTGHSDSGRARGASALEADTDAAYIVSRNALLGTVEVSRERFKSSAEQPPMVYKPKIVTLDRVDDDLFPVTSLVLEPVEGLESLTRRKGPAGRHQKHLWKMFRELSPDGATVDVVELLDLAVSRQAKDAAQGGRDLRRQNCRRALDILLDEGHLFLHDDDRVSSTPVHLLASEDWLE